MHGDRLAGYRYVQGSYATLFTKVNELQNWKDGILENCIKAGFDKTKAVKYTGRARELMYPDLLQSREALLDAIDPARESREEFFIEIEPADEQQAELVVKVILNGVIVPADDYCLEVDTFFDCVNETQADPAAVVKFIGGCGDEGCCGVEYETYKNASYWNWYTPAFDSNVIECALITARVIDYRLAWSDVLTAANQIVAEFPRLSDAYPLKSKLPDYLAKIEILKKLAALS